MKNISNINHIFRNIYQNRLEYKSKFHYFKTPNTPNTPNTPIGGYILKKTKKTKTKKNKLRKQKIISQKIMHSHNSKMKNIK